MATNYQKIIENFKKAEPEIDSVAIIEHQKVNNILYSTEDWDLTDEIEKILNIWASMSGKSITVNNKKYSILQTTPERLVATSIHGEGHIVGAKDEEKAVLAHVGKDGNMLTAYIASARVLNLLSSKEPYLEKDEELGKETIEEIFGLNKPKLREELMRGLIDFFKEGAKLEKVDQSLIERREKERKRRMEELEKVMQALEITEEDRLVNITIKADFTTDYIYDDFQLLRIKHKIQDLIKREFQLHGVLNLKIIKKL